MDEVALSQEGPAQAPGHVCCEVLGFGVCECAELPVCLHIYSTTVIHRDPGESRFGNVDLKLTQVWRSRREEAVIQPRTRLLAGLQRPQMFPFP